MACYQVQTVSVEFKAAHAALLRKAIEAAGEEILLERNGWFRLYGGLEIDTNNGTATIREGQQAQLNALKRAYAAEALKQAAKQNGWTFNATTKSRGELRRSYT